MSAPHANPQTLQASLAHVHQLLGKLRLVETLTQAQDQPRAALVESLTRRQGLAELRNYLVRLHEADIAHILGSLPREDRLQLWALLAEPRGGEVLLELSSEVREQLLEEAPRESLLQALQQLDGDDLASLADELPVDLLTACLARLEASERDWVTITLGYPEEQVGRWMSNTMVVVREQQRLVEVQAQLRALPELPNHSDKLLVIDRRGQLTGVLPLGTLLTGDGERRVAEVMATEVVRFTPGDNAREAAHAFERYDLVSAPVVNARGKLIGRLTVDVMMDFLRERNEEELLALAGLTRSEDLFTTIWDGARNRWLWLGINLGTAFLASRVIDLFEHSIAQLVALAALMPIVASIGGNTGNQTTALVIRAIAVGQTGPASLALLVRKELGINLLNAVLMGVLVGGLTALLYTNWALGGVMFAAMVCNVILAAAVGLVVPLGLHRSGRDPALGASVLLTATTDSMGFLIFLGLATLLLL